MAPEIPTQRPKRDRFLVAFSYAGEQRELVRQIAEATEQLLGLGAVFYDEWFEGSLAGSAADLKLQKIYGADSEVVVICASAAYAKKPWPLAEWDRIRERHMSLRTEGGSASDRLFPLRVADGEVEGLLGNTIWVEARQRPANHIADLILQRVRMFVPDAGKPRLFLAQTPPSLDDESQPVNRPKLQRFLEQECRYAVAPARDLLELELDQYPAALEAELAGSQAFVQLLAEKPWKPGNYDRRQFNAATERGLPQFCYQGDIHVDAVLDTGQRTFLSDCKAKGKTIAGQFEDFKHHLRQKLGELAAAKEAEVRRFQEADRRRRAGLTEVTTDATDRPLVRVANWAADTEAIWDSVFNFLDGKVLLDEIVRGDLVTQQSVEPCHGFLILCDDKSQSDEAFSPRDALANCRLIQSQQQKLDQPIAPVAVVFRAPPDPVWSRLLKSTPRCLYRVLGHDLENGLGEFIQKAFEVRRAMT
jgi:hypothetical protein